MEDRIKEILKQKLQIYLIQPSDEIYKAEIFSYKDSHLTQVAVSSTPARALEIAWENFKSEQLHENDS